LPTEVSVHIQIESLIAAAIILLVAFPVHECAHAYAAYRLGDGTAKLFGRLTLNPIVHFDPIGGLLLIASSLTGVGIGWAKPTPVNPSNLRGGTDSEGIVAFAGPASNLVLAAIGAIPLRLILASNSTPLVLYLIEPASLSNIVPKVLFYFVLINVALMLFNLVPVPPLDGSKVLFSFMSPRQQFQYRPILEQYGFILLIFVAFVPLLPGPGGSQTIFSFIFDKIGGPIVNVLIGQSVF
jgi:Zn-dependent protease